MKNKLVILLLAACSFLSCQDSIWDAIRELEDNYSNLEVRVAKLEELCSEMNTNISALQTLVSVILTNDYIISIAPVTKEGQDIGYVITFAIHEPITIYHGQDGKDGADGKDGENGKDGADGKNGADGKDGQNGENGKDGADGKDGVDGTAPIIGVALDPSDNAYYWTLNGTWLLDENGNRIPLTSRDGQNGENGKDGEDGKDGADGKDGVTPQLKIENGYWYVSTDNGATWTQLAKAVGEDGEDGADGKDGQDGKDGEKGEKGDPGDTMFQSVTQDDNFVYFTLSNGTILTVPRGDKDEKVKIVDGAIMAEFSVSPTRKVYFSMGNLQYSTEGTHQCADGTTKPGTWRFAEKQWEEGMNFYWGNSGYNDTIKQFTGDWNSEEKLAIKYYSAYKTIAQSNISNTYNDWGVYNAIDNGGNTPNLWRTLTKEEWIYLWEQRPNAEKLKGITKVNGIECTYILPDSWKNLEAIIPSELYSGEQIYDFFSANILLDKGAVFFRKNPKKNNASDNSGEGYWSSTYTQTRLISSSYYYYAYAILGGRPEYQLTYVPETAGGVSTYVLCLPVRLVKDVE